MKIKFLVLVLALASFTFQSCEELLNGIPVTLNLSENFTIGATPRGTFTVEEAVETDVENTIATVGAELDDIKSIYIQSLNVSIAEASSGASFSAFDRVSISIVADGLDEVEVASKELNGEGGESVDIDVNPDVNLADYLKKETVTYKYSMETNTDIVDPIEVKMSSAATITVQLGEQ
ncbi:MAG: hypothetical protein ACPG19_14940 [Saprospiraceae bacterium]